MGGGPREREGQEPRLRRLGVRGEVRPSMTGAPDSGTCSLVPSDLAVETAIQR